MDISFLTREVLRGLLVVDNIKMVKDLIVANVEEEKKNIFFNREVNTFQIGKVSKNLTILRCLHPILILFMREYYLLALSYFSLF